jgi:hypothetical protein
MDERYIQKRVHEILKGRIAMGGGAGVRAGAMTDWVSFVKLFRDIAEDAGHPISYKTSMELAGPVWEKLKGEGLAGGARKSPRARKAAPRRRAAGVHLLDDAVRDMFHHAPAPTKEEVFEMLCDASGGRAPRALATRTTRRKPVRAKGDGTMAGRAPAKPRARRAPRGRGEGEGGAALTRRMPRRAPVRLVY